MKISDIPENTVEWWGYDVEGFLVKESLPTAILEILFPDKEFIPLMDTDLNIIGLKSSSGRTRVYW